MKAQLTRLKSRVEYFSSFIEISIEFLCTNCQQIHFVASACHHCAILDGIICVAWTKNNLIAAFIHLNNSRVLTKQSIYLLLLRRPLMNFVRGCVRVRARLCVFAN